MSRYIATFHTHLSALLTCQRLTAAGASVFTAFCTITTGMGQE